MKRKCICCSHDPLEPVYRDLLRCPQCGHVSADLSLSDQEIADLYSKQYFNGEEYGNYYGDRAILQKNFALRIRDMQRYIPDPINLSLLEIGCAYGFFLDLAQRHFGVVKGIDIAENATEIARREMGVNAYAGDFLASKQDPLSEDVICMWDTIEHLRNPEAYIEKSAKILRPGGYLFLTTGDIGSWNARCRREKWRLIHPPTHLNYFTRKSISELLRKNGFQIREIRAVGFHRSLENILINLFRKKLNEKTLGLISKIKLSFYLNMYDIMQIVAQRESKTTGKARGFPIGF